MMVISGSFLCFFGLTYDYLTFYRCILFNIYQRIFNIGECCVNRILFKRECKNDKYRT